MLRNNKKENDILKDNLKTQTEKAKEMKRALNAEKSEVKSRDNQIDYFEKMFEKIKKEMVSVKK